MNGWGDTFLCAFDILNCIDYIKNKYQDFQIIYTVNDVHNVKILQSVLNLNFLNYFVDEFEILTHPELIILTDGFTNYKNNKYKRIYSGRNDNTHNNIPGAFDVFVSEEHFDEINERNIPFIDFTFNDIDDRVKDFDFFNEDLVKNCDLFIKNNFNDNFESIYYRSLNPVNEYKMDLFIENLNKILDKNKSYFMCSNSSIIKKKLLDDNFKIKLFRDLNNHDDKHIPNGFSNLIDDAIFAVTELMILSKCSVIYYYGEINNISLFNWYPTNVKKVKLITL